MLSRFASAARLLLARPTALPDRPHIRRDLGLDDWDSMIGTSRTDILWPLPRA